MSKRRKIVAGNWKMNLNAAQGEDLISRIFGYGRRPSAEVILFPSFILLHEITSEWNFKGRYHIGAQNCSQFEKGAYTGEVSAGQLVSENVEYVIIGHSERREYFGETNEVLKQKIEIALKYDLKPVFCCGENQNIRNKNEHKEYVKLQLQESLFHLSKSDITRIVIAYEPVWAIGTGLNASAAQAQEMHLFIRQQIASKYSNELAQQVRIIYGGSCKPSNAAELFSCPDVDGGLIGGASLVADDFLAIIKAAEDVS